MPELNPSQKQSIPADNAPQQNGGKKRHFGCQADDNLRYIQAFLIRLTRIQIKRARVVATVKT